MWSWWNKGTKSAGKDVVRSSYESLQVVDGMAWHGIASACSMDSLSHVRWKLYGLPWVCRPPRSGVFSWSNKQIAFRAAPVADTSLFSTT
jgi:hypothetical protein